MDDERFDPRACHEPPKGEYECFAPETAAAGKVYLDRFELTGMVLSPYSCRVLRAYDREMDRRVALRKGTVPAMLDKELAAALSGMEGVCPVYAVLPEERLMVLPELTSGTLLEKWARQSERIGVRMNDRSARIMVFRERIADLREILCTLGRLHAAGVGVGDVHGDNIMFLDGRPVLVDYQSINWLGSAYSGSTALITHWYGQHPPLTGCWGGAAEAKGDPWPRVTVRGDLQKAASLLDQGTLGLYMVCDDREVQVYEAATHFEELLANVIDRGIGLNSTPFADVRAMIDALDAVLAACADEPPTGMLPGETLILESNAPDYRAEREYVEDLEDVCFGDEDSVWEEALQHLADLQREWERSQEDPDPDDPSEF